MNMLGSNNITNILLYDIIIVIPRTSLDNVVGSDYAGSHWLATFLLHALEVRDQVNL